MRTGNVEDRLLRSESQKAARYRLWQIVAACEKLTSVSILGGCKFYGLAPSWKTFPRGLTSLKSSLNSSAKHLELNLLLQLDKLRELCIDGNAIAEICFKAANRPDKVAAAPSSATPNAVYGTDATLRHNGCTSSADDPGRPHCVLVVMLRRLSQATSYPCPTHA